MAQHTGKFASSTRVSSIKQEAYGLGLEAQRKAALAAAKARDVKLNCSTGTAYLQAENKGS